MTAIEFLTDTGQMCTDWRQEFILLSDTLGVSMLVDAINHAVPRLHGKHDPWSVLCPQSATLRERRQHLPRRQGRTAGRRGRVLDRPASRSPAR